MIEGMKIVAVMTIRDLRNSSITDRYQGGLPQDPRNDRGGQFALNNNHQREPAGSIKRKKVSKKRQPAGGGGDPNLRSSQLVDRLNWYYRLVGRRIVLKAE
ncbi:unnamed protein product [Urochloa humidicola]